MNLSPSKSAANRKTGKHQVDEQHAHILDAAETLFLKNGLEDTRMIDIANQAGITRVTLYRYFANCDAIAVEIQARMIQKISALVDPAGPEFTLAGQKRRVQAMIRNFEALRDAFRYIGMFDKIYLDNPPDAALTQWTKHQLTLWNGDPADSGKIALAEVARIHGNELAVIMNTVVWFLEKLALRGELTWSDPNVPLADHLQTFETMIMGYFDRLIDPPEP